VKVSLGADPEVFLCKEIRNEPVGFVSAVGIIGGSKSEPRDLGDGFFVQEDNVTAEFNIPPSFSADEFAENVYKGLANVDKLALEAGLEVANGVASCSFPESELQTEAAKLFGCDPDYDAWTTFMNDKPHCSDESFRSCGGHVHIGGIDGMDPFSVIRAMDLFLGVPAVVLDKDTKRKQLYGKAGSFRFQPYGVEYRTLSNFWIFQPFLRKWVWEATIKAVEFAKRVKLKEDSIEGKQIQLCINNNDLDMYKVIRSKYPDIGIIEYART